MHGPHQSIDQCNLKFLKKSNWNHLARRLQNLLKSMNQNLLYFCISARNDWKIIVKVTRYNSPQRQSPQEQVWQRMFIQDGHTENTEGQWEKLQRPTSWAMCIVPGLEDSVLIRYLISNVFMTQYNPDQNPSVFSKDTNWLNVKFICKCKALEKEQNWRAPRIWHQG